MNKLLFNSLFLLLTFNFYAQTNDSELSDEYKEGAFQGEEERKVISQNKVSNSSNIGNKKNKNHKLYKRYECSGLDDFLNTNDFINCDKPNQYRFYSFIITDNKIVVLELNKIKKVLTKEEFDDLNVEKRNDYYIYTKNNDAEEGEEGFQQYYVSKDKNKIINVFYGRYGVVYQTFYILNK